MITSETKKIIQRGSILFSLFFFFFLVWLRAARELLSTLGCYCSSLPWIGNGKLGTNIRVILDIKNRKKFNYKPIYIPTHESCGSY